MKNSFINCDYCDKEIKPQENTSRDYLELTNRRYSPVGPMVLDILIYPIIERDYHFCGLGCLKKWINKESNDEI